MSSTIGSMTGNPAIADAQIRDFLNQPGMTPQRALEAARANNVSAAQIARAMEGKSGYTEQNIHNYVAAHSQPDLDIDDNEDEESEDSSSPSQPGSKTGSKSKSKSKSAVGRLAPPMLQSAARSSTPRNASQALYGPGNAAVSAAAIKAFITQPGMTDDAVLQAAVQHGVSVSQIAEAMADDAAYSLDNISKHLASKGIKPPKSSTDSRSATLTGRGNSNLSDAELKAFITRPGVSNAQTLSAALSLGVSMEQVARAMRDDPAYSLDKITQYVASQGIAVPPPAPKPFSEFPASAAPARPLQYADPRAAILMGPGNAHLSDAQIKSALSQPGMTPDKALDAALANGVSMEQIARAMQDDATYSLDSIKSFVAAKGIVTEAQPQYADSRAVALYGTGNATVSDEQIRAVLAQPGMTPQRALQEAITHNVSIEQIARALNDPAYSADTISNYVATQGISKYDFRAETLYGKGNASIADEQIKAYLTQPGVTGEQAVNKALELGVSVYQIARAMDGQPGFTLDEINQRVASQGIPTQRDPAQFTDLKSSALFGPGNSLVTDDAIRAFINRPGVTDAQIFNAALQYNVSVDQIARAMAGQAAFTQENLSDYVGYKERLSQAEQLIGDLGRLTQFIRENPSVPGAQEAMDTLRSSITKLGRDLADQGVRVDGAISRAGEFDSHARGAEMLAAQLIELYGDVHRAALHAEARLGAAQSEYAKAQGSVDSAQAALNAANQELANAAGIGDKGDRLRAQDAARHKIALATEDLSAAQALHQATQAALSQVQAEAAPVIAAAQDPRARFVAADALSKSQRDAADVQIGAAGRAVEIEDTLKQALVGAQINYLDVSHTKAGVLQQQIDSGALTRAETAHALEDIRLDLQDANAVLVGMTRMAAADRAKADEAHASMVPLQTQLMGDQLIAQNLKADADVLQQVYDSIGLAQRQSEFDSAGAGLHNARGALDVAEMHMAWAEGKKDPKKQAAWIADVTPALEAARAGFPPAQQAYDQAQQQLSTARILAEPIAGALIDANYAADSAAYAASISGAHVGARSALAGLTEARYQGSELVLAAAQARIIETTRIEGRVLQSVAANTGDAGTANRLNAQAKGELAWADQYSALATEARNATAVRRLEQATQYELDVQAGSADRYSTWLQGKVDTAQAAYDQTYQNLNGLHSSFQLAYDKAAASVPLAEEAYKAMLAMDVEAAFAFVKSRAKLSPEQEAQASSDKAAFVEGWLAQDLARRKDARKQLHLYDDLSQFKNAHADLTSARQASLQTAQTANQDSQAVIDAGDREQAGLMMFDIRGELARIAQDQSLEAAKAAAQLGHHASGHAAALGQAAQAEQAAWQGLAQGLQSTFNPSDAKTTEALQADASTAGELAAAVVSNAQASSQAWTQFAQTLAARATSEQEELTKLQATLDARNAEIAAPRAQDTERLLQAHQVDALSHAVILDHADRVADASALHDRRVRYDEVKKKRDKNSVLMQVGITIAAVAAMVITDGLASGWIAGMLGAAEGAAVGAGAGAGAGAAAGASAGGSAAAGAAVAGAEVGASTGIGAAVASFAAEAGTVLTNLVGSPGTFVRALLGRTAPVVATEAGGTTVFGTSIIGVTGLPTLETAGVGFVSGGLGGAAFQGVRVAGGLQDKFLMKDVWKSAISMGIMRGGAAVGSNFARTPVGQLLGLNATGPVAGVLAPAARGAVTLAINVGALKAAGILPEFDWNIIAAAAASGAFMGTLNNAVGAIGVDKVATALGASGATNVGAILRANPLAATAVTFGLNVSRQLIFKDGPLDYVDLASRAFGNSIGTTAITPYLNSLNKANAAAVAAK